jgi:hypothetical protein
MGGKGLIPSYLALPIAMAMAASAAAAGDARQLRFDWPNPTAATTCELVDNARDAKKPMRYAGTVERQDMGLVCTVQIARRRFDATYRACAIDYADSPPRERYACWLSYTPREVVFLYSYSDEPTVAPPCAFACIAK